MADLIEIKYNDGRLDDNFCSHDQMGLLLVINHLFVSDPDRFGDDNIRGCLQSDISSLISSGASHSDLLGGISDIIDSYDIAPFADVSVALVGIDDVLNAKDGEEIDYVFISEGGRKLISGFEKVEDISPLRNERYLKVDGALDLVGNNKVDYVVTGNVLNLVEELFNIKADELFAASANLLKQSGQAFHLLAYSIDNYNKISDPKLQDFVGQKYIGHLKEESVRYTYFQLEQTKEVALTSQHSEWFRENIDFPDRELSQLERYLISNPQYIEQLEFASIEEISSDLSKLGFRDKLSNMSLKI